MENDVVQIDLFYRFGAALLIGLLVGLQREFAHIRKKEEEKFFAGTRTFTLLALLGCTAAFFAERAASAWPFVAVVMVDGWPEESTELGGDVYVLVQVWDGVIEAVEYRQR